MTDALAIVLVNYGTSALLERNVVALGQSLPDARVVIVDNLSTVAERQSVLTVADRYGWTLVPAPGNLGFGGGMNLGVATAQGLGADRFLLINPDATIEVDSVRLLERAIVTEPMVLAAPTIYRPDATVWSDGNDILLSDGRVRSSRTLSRGDASHGALEWLTGACLMVSDQLWTATGGFDAEYFMYWEDVDFSFRVVKAGGRLQLVPGAVAIHSEGGAQSGQDAQAGDDKPHSLSRLYFRYNARNRLLFAARHLDAAGRRRWRHTAVREAWRVARRGGRRHLLTSTMPIAAVAAGTIEGLRLCRVDPQAAPEPLTVMLSFPPPLVTSNPYNVMVAASLAEAGGLKVRNFSWRGALLGSYDVFHAQWPETMLVGRSRLRRGVKQLFFAALLLRLWFSRTPWVRTVHNLALPEGLSRGESALLQWGERLTTLRITINPVTPLPAGAPFEVALHGDYVDWFSRYTHACRNPGRILFFGTVRRYKGTPDLLTAFRETDDSALTLRIAGRLSHPNYRDQLRQIAQGDDRISMLLEFLTDAQLVREVTSSELVVLPYPQMHNSGSVLCSLSLNCPVLVPDNEVNRLLSREVGEGWVHLFAGPLRGLHIEETLAVVRSQPPTRAPDFSSRTWDGSGERHAHAYRRAIALRKGLGRQVEGAIGRVP